jgi:hypothetical protein
MKGKFGIALVVLALGLLLVVYTYSTTAGGPETPVAQIPAVTRVVTTTPLVISTKTVVPPTVVRTATPLIFPTFTPIRIPVFTGTPVPTLTAHVWKSNLIVVKMYVGGGEGGPGLNYYSFPFSLLILSDGQVFTYNKQGQIVTAKLSQTELCSLLNTIDQFGFFDYDAKSYLGDRDPTYYHPAFYTSIVVNAWRSISIGLPDFEANAEGQLSGEDNCPFCSSPTPTILPALWNTYWFLNRYTPNGLELYQPDRLAVWVAKRWEGQPEDRQWPLTSPTLKQLYNQTLAGTQPFAQLGDSAVIEGKSAATLFNLFENTDALTLVEDGGLWFSDGKDAYLVYERPLLPYEAPIREGHYQAIIPDPSISIPSTTLSCQPSDGVLAMPQP